MATVTRVLGGAGDGLGNQATLTIAYDDGTLRVQSYTVANPTIYTARLVARRNDGTGPTYTQDTPAGQTVTVPLPQQPNQRLTVTVDARGRLDGIDYQFGLVD